MKIEAGATPGEWVLGTGAMRPFGGGKGIDLRYKVKTVDIISHHKSEAKSGVGGAAAGAVLGFLVAGPVGTLVGAGAG